MPTRVSANPKPRNPNRTPLASPSMDAAATCNIDAEDTAHTLLTLRNFAPRQQSSEMLAVSEKLKEQSQELEKLRGELNELINFVNRSSIRMDEQVIDVGRKFQHVDEALKYAAMIPSAEHGRIEVRPVMIFD